MYTGMKRERIRKKHGLSVLFSVDECFLNTGKRIQMAFQPPSIMRSWPVVKEEASEAK